MTLKLLVITYKSENFAQVQKILRRLTPLRRWHLETLVVIFLSSEESDYIYSES